MQYWKLTQSQGPTIKFDGEMIATIDFERPGRGRPVCVSMNVFQAETGEIIAQQLTEPVDGNGYRSSRATVVQAPEVEIRISADLKPGDAEREIDQAQQTVYFRVMDFFEWDNRARSMVREQLGWSLDVDLRGPAK